MLRLRILSNICYNKPKNMQINIKSQNKNANKPRNITNNFIYNLQEYRSQHKMIGLSPEVAQH